MLGIAIFVNVYGIYLELNTPVENNIEIESEGLNVRVFMYENDKKEVRVGVEEITVRNIVRNNPKVILKSFVPNFEANDRSMISKHALLE